MEKERKTGLVLEGGGMRGIYTAGVLDVFLDHRIGFDGVIGVSAGAIHGCSFVSGQKERSIRYYKEYCADKRFMSWESFFRTGNLVNTEFCYHEIPEKLDPYDFQAFARSETAFYVGCSNVETGEPEYIRIRDMKQDIDYIRASASMPYVSETVQAGGMKLLDGGCTDSIPVKAFMKLGYERNVVILTRQKGYKKKPEKAGLERIVYRHYPAFARALRNRPWVYNRQLEEIEELKDCGKAFLIRPSEPLNISRVSKDKNEIEAVYRLGVEDGTRMLPALLEWLGTDAECFSK